jgi:hypothetical protein
MNEDWERDLKPDSVKVAEELEKEKMGPTITISKTWYWNWDDWLERMWHKIRGDK